MCCQEYCCAASDSTKHILLQLKALPCTTLTPTGLNYMALNINAMPCVSREANAVAWVNGTIRCTTSRFLNNKPLPCASFSPKSLHIKLLDMEIQAEMRLQEDGVAMLQGTTMNFFND